jgi:hypothetical protein
VGQVLRRHCGPRLLQSARQAHRLHSVGT